jgi:hypothetical protein
MPRNKDLKRLVRARMEKTGEAYTAARAHLTKKAKTTVPAVNYAELAGMSDDGVSAKTGRTWKEWVETLDKHDAAAMAHRDIAEIVSKTYKVADWWSQTVTVGYERIKGLRVRGQRRDGTYEVSKSRTYNVPVSTLFKAWADAKTRRKWLDAPDAKVRSSTANKAMRIHWADGTVVILGFIAKGSGKSIVSVAHTKLADREMGKGLKDYWTKQLDALGDLIVE